MSSGRLIGLAVLLALSAPAICGAAGGSPTHTYPVALTIAADQVSGKIEGEIVTKAPSEFCESGKVRIRAMAPGKDDVVARVKPSDGKWRLQATAALSGRRIYAEVSRYELPNRPVICLEARSPTVTAP